MAQLTGLPHWDMTTVFPSLESPEFAAAFAKVREEVQAALLVEIRPHCGQHDVFGERGLEQVEQLRT